MNKLDIILAASGPEAAAASSGTFEVVGVGFTFVMVVLALLAAVTAAIGALFVSFDAKKTAQAALKAAQATSAAPGPAPVPVAAAKVSEPQKADSDDDPVLAAVIAAAVHSVIGDRAHRIVSIRPGGPGWAQEGRRQIFSSHRVR
jgi:Na+-transporting methylmalonyl-CoA/oxaloacetate decarboxylase gamma subunit